MPPRRTPRTGSAKPKLNKSQPKTANSRSSGSRAPSATTTKKASAWPSEPTPLDCAALPSFPSEVLPAWLRSWTEAQAEGLQVPVDLPGLLGLGTVSAAAAKRWTVIVREDWIEPLNLFALVALPSGSRKSVLFERAIAPLVERETALHRAWERQHGVDETVEQDERPKLRSGKPHLRVIDEDEDEGAAELAEASDPTMVGEAPASARASIPAVTNAPSLASVPQVEVDRVTTSARADFAFEEAVRDLKRPPVLCVADVTPERVGQLLAENGGRLAVLSDEGEIAAILGGKHGASFEVFLKGYSGSPISVERTSRRPVRVRQPSLTLVLAVQPDVLHALSAKRAARERGLLARFLVSLPPSNLGFRKIDTKPVPKAFTVTYKRAIEALLDARTERDGDGEMIPRELQLDAAAGTKLAEFQHEVELMLRPGGDLAALVAWGGKLTGLVARIAGLLHLATHAEEIETAHSTPIAAATIEKAIEIGRYAIAHARTAFGHAGVDRRLDGAKRILAWLKSAGRSEVTKRDIHIGLQAHLPKAGDLDAPLTMLIERGYLRLLAPATSRGGRPSSPVYQLHPAIRE